MRKILDWLRAELRRSADRDALLAMSAHELTDLGIGRTEAGYLISRFPDAPPDRSGLGVPGSGAGRRDALGGRGLAERHGVFP